MVLSEMQAGFCCSLCMMSRQWPSTMRNFFPSLGICFMMSSEPKMGSRYSQAPCTLVQASMMSCVWRRKRSHSPSREPSDLE